MFYLSYAAGMPVEESYRMPVRIREWFFNRLLKEKEAETDRRSRPDGRRTIDAS